MLLVKIVVGQSNEKKCYKPEGNSDYQRGKRALIVNAGDDPKTICKGNRERVI